jgi:hypothetical protein
VSDAPREHLPSLWVGALQDEIARAAGPLSLLLAELEDAERVMAVEPSAEARDTDRAGARALGERIAAAVREAAAWRGAPLVATVGLAVLGQDGRASGELIDAAERARFAAAASGAEVWRGEED